MDRQNWEATSAVWILEKWDKVSTSLGVPVTLCSCTWTTWQPAHISKLGRTYSRFLSAESLILWQEAIQKKVHNPPHFALADIVEDFFFSRHSLLSLNFRLIRYEFQRVCQRLSVWPTLDAISIQDIGAYKTKI